MVASELRNHLLFHFSVLSQKLGRGGFDPLINHCDRREYTENPRETFKKNVDSKKLPYFEQISDPHFESRL